MWRHDSRCDSLLLAGKRRFPPKTITSHVEPRNAFSRRPNVSYVGTSLISVGERLIFAHQAGCAEQEQSFRRTQSDWTAAGEQPIDRVQNSQAARRRSSDASQDLCLSSRNLTDSLDNNSSGNSWTKPRSASGVT